jgi:hypothetical protein
MLPPVSPRRLRLIALAALILPFAGCGYELIRYPADRSSAAGVAIQSFVNDSFEPGFEFMLVDALRKEIARRGALKLTNQLDTASYVLGGRVVAIDTGRRSFSSVVLALEYEVRVQMELELARPGTPIALDGRVISESELYLASADVESTRKNRQEALRRIAGVMAVRIHDVMVEVAPPL